MVDYLINRDTIRLHVKARNWKQAVRQGVSPLIRQGAVEPRYYRAIIESVKKNGPYFVLMPQVALPHARPEEGALDQGFSLITLRQPINFGSVENDPIRVLLTFSAKDADDQLEGALAQAVTIFEDEHRIEAIIKCSTVEAIIDILKSIDFSEVEE